MIRRILSAMLLPLIISSGLWGMNNADLPASVSWGGIVGVTLSIGVASLVVILLFFRYSSRKMKALRDALAEHEASQI